MSELEVGPLKVLLGLGSSTRETAKVFGNVELVGDAVHAMVVGPDGLQLEIRYFLADDGQGSVSCTSRGPSAEEYERLVRGARLGVYRDDDGSLLVKQLRLLRWDPKEGWGNPSLTTESELDSLLGSSMEELLESAGVLQVGTKLEVLGKPGTDLAMRWGAEAGARPALAAYALTRVLPIVRAYG